jgi:hypothetical protein
MKCSPAFAWTKKAALASAIAMLLTQMAAPPPCRAQPFPESSRQKLQEEQRKANDKATEEAYKSYMKRTPSVEKKVDPWGSLRAPSTGK